MKHGKLFSKPDIPQLQEAAARSGFVNRDQLEAICRYLPQALQGLVTFCFITGWRLADEAQSLEWHQVDFKAGVVRLEPGGTKNGSGREFHFTANLRIVLEAQRAAADRAQREHDCVVPWVFFRLTAKGRGGPKQPKPIRSLNKAWKVACVAAGCPGRIPHDLRRSAIRTFVRAGISQNTAMAMAGHKTASVFRRYDIISPTDLSEASAKLDAAIDRDSSVTVAAKCRPRGSRAKRFA